MNISVLNSSEQLAQPIRLIFVPLVFTVFMIGPAFNSLLLVLICKARKVNNNTNVYLFSLRITGLMRAFTAFTLIVTLAADDWVLGKGICSINQMFSKLLFNASALLFLAMSHDRYRAVKYPFTYWKIKIHITIIINIAIWIVSFILGLPGSVLAVSFIAQKFVLSWTDCFIGTNEFLTMRSPIVIFDISYIVLVTFSTGLTLIYYVLITKELRSIAKYRLHCTLPAETINTKDKPIECSVEKQTAKSLASFILFQSVCSVTVILFTSISITRMLFLGRANSISQTIYVTALFFYVFPAINPFLLTLNNPRFRKRVKDLFKWKLEPDNKYEKFKNIITLSNNESDQLSYTASI